MTRALVLGGSGFIGSKLVQKLSISGYEVTSLSRSKNDTPSKNVTYVTGSFLNENLLDNLLPEIDVVFHLASATIPATSMQSITYDCETNTLGTIRLLESMQKFGVKKIVYASSGGTVYGIPDQIPTSEVAPTFPINAYGVSKVSIEKYLRLFSYNHEINATTLRISNPFGPGQKAEKGQGVIATFTKRILNKEPIEIWGDGLTIRDYIFIDDVIEAFVCAATSEKEFSIYNIGSGIGHSVNQLVSEIEKQSGIAAELCYKPARRFDIPAIILDISKAKEELCWSPTYNLQQGIEILLEEFAHN